MQRYEKVFRFNTEGVKNFLYLTIIKSRKRKTAYMIVKMIINQEQYICWHLSLLKVESLFFYISTILQILQFSF